MIDKKQILFLLREHDVQSGVSHPAEVLVAASLKQDPKVVIGIATKEDVVIRSRALEIIGRVATDSVGIAEVLSQALLDSDIRIRDAAVCAIEELGLLDLLRDHKEEIPWLDKYIKDVLSD